MMESEEEELDTLHRQIYQSVVDEVPKAVKLYMDIVHERRKLFKGVSKKIRLTDVRKLKAEEISGCRITGADGGANGKELEGFYFGIAGAIAYTSIGLEEEDTMPISRGFPLLWDDEFDPGRRIAAIRDRIMYEVARDAVEKKKPNVLLLDGPLTPNMHYIPSRDDSEAYEEDYRRMMDALLSLLNLVKEEHEERQMLFACVVKRVRSTCYSQTLSLPKPLRDSVILNPLMKIGQRTDLIDVSGRRIVREEFPAEQGQVKQFFMKTSRLSPVRVEVPGWLSEEVDEIASLIYSTADPLSGVPFHILRADALTRVNIPTTDLAYTRFISHVMDKVNSGELREEDLDMANLRRLEVWRL